jgi:hypothetical protein
VVDSDTDPSSLSNANIQDRDDETEVHGRYKEEHETEFSDRAISQLPNETVVYVAAKEPIMEPEHNPQHIPCYTLYVTLLALGLGVTSQVSLGELND